MKALGLMWVICFVLCSLAAAKPKAAMAPAKPAIQAQAGTKRKVMAATSGTIPTTVGFDYGDISFNPDGSVDLRVYVTFNGAKRTRVFHLANTPGGILVQVDQENVVVNGSCQGVMAGTTACTTLLGPGGAPYLLDLGAKIVAMMSSAPMQRVLTAP